MNPNTLVDSFLTTLRVCQRTQDFKRRVLRQFCCFLEESEGLSAGNWSFDKAKKVFIGDKVFFMPLDTPLIMDFLAAYGKQHKGLSYNMALSTIKQFCWYLVAKKILLENIALCIEPRRLKTNDTTLLRLNFEQAKRLLTAAHSSGKHRVRNFCLTLMLLTSSTRIGEAITITERDIILEKDIIYVHGKSGYRQRLLTEGLGETITVLLKDPQRLTALERTDKAYLFYSLTGGPLTTEEANALLKSLAQVAGITTDITTYWLRRTYATMLARSGFVMRMIQQLFDHDRESATRIYVRETNNLEIRPLVVNSPMTAMATEVLKELMTVVDK